ncbi:hypothetical protein RIF29_35823 [Crotalaria pallida]|uniref:CLAVATA3/ESR (CLE)-related protein n=1 Tax=Crotalaria pallida TaxID=3830 RepID=A0AAN9HY62_CROPI
MAMLKFLCCMILVICSVIVCEPRPLILSFESHAAKSDFPLGSKRVFLVVSGLKGMEDIKHKPNRLSPMGPDPRHH